MREDTLVSSPPYNPPMSQDHSGKRGGVRGHTPSEKGAFARYGNTRGQLEGLPMGEQNIVIAGSPPYVKKPFAPGIDMTKTPTRKPEWNNAVVQQRLDEQAQGYGNSPGQLGAMPPGALVSSPPYSETQVAYIKSNKGDAHREMGVVGHRNQDDGYGNSDGQLSEMPPGEVESVVSSPPYGAAHKAIESPGGMLDVNRQDLRKWVWTQGTQGQTDGQLASEQGDTFWSATRTILEQCFAALKPGAHTAWVLKAFVRNKKIVDFPGQWQQLCESVGFETVVIARAWQVKDDGTQLAIDGKHKHLHKEHKGFFRRNHEKKFPATRIDFEIVLFQVRP